MLTSKVATLVAVPFVTIALVATWLLSRQEQPDPVESLEPPVANALPAQPAGVPPQESPTMPVSDPGDAAVGPDTETIMGFAVRTDRDCTVERVTITRPDGTHVDAVRCVGDVEPGQYDHYTDEELVVLAYDTADAAFALGRRLYGRNPELAKRYVLRAVALDPGNIGPISWLAALSSERGTSARARRAIAEQYELTRILEQFNPQESTAWLVDDVRDAGITAEQLRALDERARANVEYMRGVQIEVFGSPTIGEDVR